ncbi:hypothetical protein B0H10DRAFT_2217348 [Mycena sp. CBHHK59/15]|nr:hypothetical protein B0H10DRAFT_2217348 [Mycena sp. CBHHK59/15]
MAYEQLPAEGTRLALAGHLGTVRFVGNVDNTTGVWLGVEWDDPKRGKHDGVKDGKRYFTCRVHNAGSFIRPTAAAAISYGTSFLKALYSKYVELPHGSASQEKVLLGSSNGAIEVEAVDLDKIRGKFANLDQLREVSLDNEYVARYDEPPGMIRNTCPNVRGLDLSTSLIPTWDMVALISAELPTLQRLALNRNRLQSPRDPQRMALAFNNLMELRLNGTLMTWEEMQQVTASMPVLCIVEMGYNFIEKLSSVETNKGSTVETINLDSNNCRDWVHICESLRPYSSLDRLVLTSNKIDKITAPLAGQCLRVKHLSLSFNRLESWNDIDALAAWCPTLDTLTLIGNPVVDSPALARNSRQFVIARIPSLLALDAAAISAKERVDCELLYLSHIAHQGPQSEDERNRAHPRWAELCKKHGPPDEHDNNQHQEKLSRRMMELNMYHASDTPALNADHREINSLIEKSEYITLRVLPTMTLRALRLKIMKTMKYRTLNTAISLWLQMRDNSCVALESDRDSQDLAWLGVESGSNIIFVKHDK